jgi:DeoR/GlpR family transcriptional regulator of sugar metabolism
MINLIGIGDSILAQKEHKMVKRVRSLSRQERIVQILLDEKTISVSQLAKQLHVSEWTVRRDLSELEEKQLVERSYGQAALVKSREYRSFLSPNDMDSSGRLSAKRLIGAVAAKLVQPGQHVAISAGTTTTEVALALKERTTSCFVVTNALNIAKELSTCKDIRVTCTGGEVDGDYCTLNGPVAERILRAHYFDLAILGVSGITLQEGITVNSQLNAVALDIMFQHAKRIVVVADRTKFGEVRFAHLAPIDAVDIIVTDQAPHKAFCDYLSTVGVELIFPSLALEREQVIRPDTEVC